MVELTDKQIELFGRVSRWHAARVKVAGELKDLNKQIARLESRRTALLNRLNTFGDSIQTAVDTALARIP